MKKPLLLLLLILLLLNARIASCQKFDWVTQEGGFFTDVVEDLVVDKQGNTYAAGTFTRYENMPKVIPGKINTDSTIANVLVKYDPKGKLLWFKEFGLGGGRGRVNLCLDKSGNVYVGATFQHLWFHELGINLGYDRGPTRFVVAKFTSGGSIIWWKTGLGGLSNMVTDDQQNLYLAGTQEGSFSSTTDNFEGIRYTW